MDCLTKNQLIEVALKDPRTNGDRRKVTDWLDEAEIIGVPGGAVIFNGNRVHVEISENASKTRLIRSLQGVMDKFFCTHEYMIANIPTENVKMIRVAKWMGFRVERERNGDIELRKEKP